jgi:TRAP-type C4-dicarboxylate transport system permease small subunit
LKPILALIDRVLKIAVSVCYATLIAVTVVGVFFRYVLNDSLIWSEELGRYLFVWIVFLGAAMGMARGTHVSVDFLVERMPPPARLRLAIVIEFLIIVFLVVLVVQGFTFAKFGVKSFSLGMGIPMAWVYAALPVSSVIMILYSLKRIAQKLGAARNARRGK